RLLRRCRWKTVVAAAVSFSQRFGPIALNSPSSELLVPAIEPRLASDLRVLARRASQAAQVSSVKAEQDAARSTTDRSRDHRLPARGNARSLRQLIGEPRNNLRATKPCHAALLPTLLQCAPCPTLRP